MASPYVVADSPAPPPPADAPKLEWFGSFEERLRAAIADVLMPAAAAVVDDTAVECGGVPVPPLIALIVKYVFRPLTVSRIDAFPVCGPGDEAWYQSLFRPTQCCVYLPSVVGGPRADRRLLLFAEPRSHAVCSLQLSPTACDQLGQFVAPTGEAEWRYPSSLCVRPSDNSLLVCDTAANQIYRVDALSGAVAPLAGVHQSPGYADAPTGLRAKFAAPSAIVCTRDGSAAYVTDYNSNRIRKLSFYTAASSGALDVKVSTAAGTGQKENCDSFYSVAAGSTKRLVMAGSGSILLPRVCAWDEYHKAGPNTILYVSAHQSIRRLHVRTGELTTVPLPLAPNQQRIYPAGLVSFARHMVLVGCMNSCRVYLIHTRDGTCEALPAEFKDPTGLYLDRWPDDDGGCSGDRRLFVCIRDEIQTVTGSAI